MSRSSPSLDFDVVATRLREGARLFVFMGAERASVAMAGRLASDGSLAPASRSFADDVRRRLETLRALNRRRAVLARAGL
jgi:hypothetical protein